jgi:hypothetical protein
MNISQFAKAVGLSTDTVRHSEKKGDSRRTRLACAHGHLMDFVS